MKNIKSNSIKSISDNDIKLLILSTGEQIIGYTNPISKTKTNLLYPMKLDMRMTKDGTLILMNNYIPFSLQDGIILINTNIITTSTITDELKTYYKKNIEYNRSKVEPVLTLNLIDITNSIDRMIGTTNDDNTLAYMESPSLKLH